MSMLEKFLYPLKPVKIFIFIEETGTLGILKKYITPMNLGIKAYVRQLSANEQMASDAVKNASVFEFVIMKRDVEIDMYIEFNGKTYQIIGVDFMEFYKAEIKLRANLVNEKEYSKVVWS